ncbi:MAG TPA: DsbC family protein [Geobacteraceae bacterium]
MFRLLLIIAVGCCILAGRVQAMAPEGCSGDCITCHSLSDQDAAKLLKEIGVVKSVKMAQVRGLYEVTLEKDGKQAIAYLDYGKKYLMPGPIFSLATRQVVGGAQPQPKPVEKVDVAKIPLAGSLIMGNAKGSKRLIVFTDPECPYCAKLHGELKKLVAAEPDLAIYIKLYPLKMHPSAYDKARVILGRNSLELLDKSFAGQSLPAASEKDRKDPVDESMKLAESFGISATPTLVLPDGRVIMGYRPFEELKGLLQ